MKNWKLRAFHSFLFLFSNCSISGACGNLGMHSAVLCPDLKKSKVMAQWVSLSHCYHWDSRTQWHSRQPELHSLWLLCLKYFCFIGWYEPIPIQYHIASSDHTIRYVLRIQWVEWYHWDSLFLTWQSGVADCWKHWIQEVAGLSSSFEMSVCVLCAVKLIVNVCFQPARGGIPWFAACRAGQRSLGTTQSLSAGRASQSEFACLLVALSVCLCLAGCLSCWLSVLLVWCLFLWSCGILAAPLYFA